MTSRRSSSYAQGMPNKKRSLATKTSVLTQSLGILPNHVNVANQDAEERKRLTDSDSDSDQEGFGPASFKEKKKRGAWIAENFKRKACTKYTPKPNTAKKACYCGGIKRQHNREAQNAEDTGPKEDPCGTLPDLIQEYPTDAYGEIQFGQAEGINNRAKYVRLSNTTDSSLILELLMYYWKLPRPRLVLSITGGGRSFKLNKQDQDTFSRGITKAAQTTDAWIITSGFNAGVPKIVGQTMKECQTMKWLSQGAEAADGQGLNCIGIAPWGYVSGSNQLIDRHGKGSYPARYQIKNVIVRGKPVPLNQNHSHFIFVDNGLQNEPAYGGEIKMRAEIEGAIQAPVTVSGLGLPVILLVLEGGADTILNVKSSISQGISTVVCEGTGRAADILAYAYRHSKEDEDGIRHVEGPNLDVLEEKIQIAFGIDPDSEIMDKILQNINICVRNEKMITVFAMNEGENSDLDLAILTALLKGQATTPFYQLALAISWDRVDVAQKYICTDEVNWPPGSLDSFLMQAISANQVDFVELFLEQGIVMKDFLTVSRLRLLYNTSEEDQHFRKLLVRLRGGKLSDDIFLHDVSLILKHLLGGHQDALYHNDKQQNCSRESLTFVVLATALSGINLVQKSSQEYLKSQRKKVTTGSVGLGMAELANPGMKFARPFSELFLWALLTDRIPLAEFFWQQIENPILAAIMASCILNNMAGNTDEPQDKTQYHQHAKKFEELATDVLDKCYETDAVLAQMMLDLPNENMGKTTVLSMAAEARDMKFISHTCCQSLLNNIWNGGIRSGGWKIILGILFPVLILMRINFHPTDDGAELKPVQKLKTFYQAPITRFWMATISYCCLVLLYSFVILSKFEAQPTAVEYVLTAWLVVLVIEEFRQAFIMDEEATITQRFKLWLGDEWNNLDGLFLLCSLLGATLHNLNVSLKYPQAFYAVGCFLLYTRSLRTSAISSHLGPLLVMIRKMIKEMLGFLFILLVFLLGYGVASESLRHPHDEFSGNSIIRVFYQPYFQIYGELFLDSINNDDADCNEPGGPHCSEQHPLLPIMLALYLLLGNVLLLNLLIAIFSAVFEEVQTNSLEIWKFEMYTLVMESAELPMLPPPFVIFEHVFYISRWALGKCRRCCKNRKTKDKPIYNKKQKRMLKLFEKECAADFRKKRAEKQSAEIPERIKRLDKKLENLNKLYEMTSVEITKQLQNLNKNLSSRLNLSTDLLESPRKSQQGDMIPKPQHDQADPYVSSEKSSDTFQVKGQIHSHPGQVHQRKNLSNKVQEFDAVSQSSKSSEGDEGEKRKRRESKRKKRSAKVEPKEQINGVEDNDGKWVNTPPGPPVVANHCSDSPNIQAQTAKPGASSAIKSVTNQNSVNKDEHDERSKLKECSVSHDQLTYMDDILQNEETESQNPFTIDSPDLPHCNKENKQRESTHQDSVTAGVGTAEEPKVSQTSDTFNGDRTAHCETDFPSGFEISRPTKSRTTSTRMKARMSVSVDHFLYMDTPTDAKSMATISEDVAPNADKAMRNHISNTPNLEKKTPNCAISAGNVAPIPDKRALDLTPKNIELRNPFSTGEPVIPSDSLPQILMANFTTKSSVSVEIEPASPADTCPTSTNLPPNSPSLPPNSAHLPPNSAKETPEGDSFDGACDQITDDDRQALVSYQKNKRRPKRMDMSVDDFLKSVDKL